MSDKKLLVGRTWNVDGTWYEPEKFLRKTYPSVVQFEYTDTTSSAGDWWGYIVQRILNRWYLIIFGQDNNYPDKGYTLRTAQTWLACFPYEPSKEEIYSILFPQPKQDLLYTFVDNIEIGLTEEDANHGYHMGECDDDVKELIEVDYIKEQLSKYSDEELRNAVRAYAVEDTESMNRERLEKWIVFLAAGNIIDEDYSR